MPLTMIGSLILLASVTVPFIASALWARLTRKRREAANQARIAARRARLRAEVAEDLARMRLADAGPSAPLGAPR